MINIQILEAWVQNLTLKHKQTSEDPAITKKHMAVPDYLIPLVYMQVVGKHITHKVDQLITGLVRLRRHLFNLNPLLLNANKIAGTWKLILTVPNSNVSIQRKA